MIGEVLAACEQGFVDGLAALEAKVAGADEEKAAPATASSEAQAQLEAKKQDCTEKEATLEKIREGIAPKKAALSAAQKEQKGLEKKPEARGEFDNVVLSQLGNALKERAASH